MDAAGKGKELLLSHAHLVKERNAAAAGTAGNKVKLCGYLKKKRNRVGGWRKLWFVLQDKLLLSYGSKEEYDNKLVSFKDVLNLVPGTLVRPLGGFRFTIETTSQAMYTFHCDDRSAYREWIAKLLDSLATQPSVARVQKFSHRFCNYSVDNIPNALSITSLTATSSSSTSMTTKKKTTTAFSSNMMRDMTHSFDSISHAERITAVPPPPPPSPPLSSLAGSGCVRLPIAHNTAKLLERNGVNSTDLQVLLGNRKENSSGTRYHQREDHSNTGQHFRLHYNNNNMSTAARSSATDLRTSSGSIYQQLQQHQSASAQSVLMINRLFNSNNIHSNNNKSAEKHDHFQRLRISPKTGHFEATIRSTTTNNNFKEKPTKRNCDRIYENASAFESETGTASSCTKECKALGLVKDQIQRMSIKGSRESTLDAETDKQRIKVITTKSLEQVIMQTKNATQSNGEDQAATKSTTTTATINQNNNLQLEPIYAVIDLKHKYAHRKMRNSNSELLDKRCSSYDSIILSTMAEPPQTSGAQHQTEKSSSLAEDDIDGIYEDGETFFSPSCTSTTSRSGEAAGEQEYEDEENIYEPINVCSSQQHHRHHQTNAFWRYFTRLKVNSFLHLTRMRKRSADYDSIKLSNIAKTTTTKKLPQQLTSSSSASAAAGSSHFSSIKHKFGTHRKSMQLRMRRLCTRAAYEPKPFFKHSTPATTISSNGSCGGGGCGTTPTVPTKSKSKYRWKSVKVRPKHHLSAKSCGSDGSSVEPTKSTERSFFGSLPHLRKPRVSIFIANATSKNQLTLKESDGGRGGGGVVGGDITDLDRINLSANVT